MDAELNALEEKIQQFAKLCQQLRADNNDMRQQLATALSDNKQLSDKIGGAMSRLEKLLADIPEQEA